MLKKITKTMADKFDSLTNLIKDASVIRGINILGKVIKYTSHKNVARLLSIIATLAPNRDFKDIMQAIKEDFERKGSWYGLIQKLFSEINPRCREKFIKNLVLNQHFRGELARKKFKDKEGFIPPQFFVISPTMTCNLRCFGCYAGEYTKNNDLPYNVIDRLIKEGKELGTYFYTISGGEPFFRHDLLRIFKKHHDCYFLVYTNGTLINQKLAKKIAQLGNVAPGISVEGFQRETNLRRGKGSWEKIMKAMDHLRAEGVFFGFSATATRLNSDIIASEKFMDFYIKKGCSFGWIFQYIPIGRHPDTKLMATPEQRNHLRKFIHGVCRKKQPILIGDFWNDGPYVGGCMAGGSLYFHINVHGDVEPCAFVHFAVDNVKKKSLKECLKSKFFKILRSRVQSIRATKPYSDNLLTPCMIIDNPWVLREAVKEAGAKPTHRGAETIISDPEIIKHLDRYSRQWHSITDPIWQKEYCASCQGNKKNQC